MPRSRVLIVEDDADIASAIARGLRLNGYDALVEDQTEAAAIRLADPEISAAVVDVMIGEDNGLELVANARAQGITKPILMLSALATVDDRAAGLKAGADDYVVKPFMLDELVARLQVQEARAVERAAPPFDFDRHTRIARRGSAEVALTEREADLLGILINAGGTPVSRGQIFDTLWAEDGGSSENVVDVYVGYLRRKLRPADTFGVEIKTIRNRGFMLKPLRDSASA